MWQVSQEWSTKCLESSQQEDFLQSLLENLQWHNSLLTEKGRSILEHIQLFQSLSLYLAKIYLFNLLSLLIALFLSSHFGCPLNLEHSYYSPPVVFSLGRMLPGFSLVIPYMKLVWATLPSWSVLLPCLLKAWAHNQTKWSEEKVWLSSCSWYYVLSNVGYAHLIFLGRHTTPLTEINLTLHHPASPKLSFVRIPLVELVIALIQ